MSDFEAVLRWYLVLAAVGAAGLPIALMLFGPFGTRAPWFARTIGLLAVFVPGWFLSSALNVPYSTAGLWITMLVIGAAGWLWVTRTGLFSARLLPGIVASELTTLGVFLGALWLRGFNPEILNTEKPMDVAFLSATIRTDQMPPADPWMAGEKINYYYVGYALHGALARLSGIEAPTAFNLALITTTVLLVTAVAGALLVALPRWGGIAAAIGAFLVVVAGNMDGPYRLLSQGRAAWDADWWRGMGWNSSRVVVDGTVDTINEFPAFSIILGDLHPHLTALPFTIVALALAIAIIRQQKPVSWVQIAGAGIIGGALYAMNSWDLPTYFGLLLIACAWSLRRLGWKAVVTRLGAAVAVALVAWAPFFLSFTPFVAGDPSSLPSGLQHLPIVSTLLTTISTNNYSFTSAGEFLRVFGLPYVVIVIALAVAAADLPAAIAENQATRQMEIAAGGIAVTLIAVISILAGAPVLLLVGLPAAVAIWVVLRRGLGDPAGLMAGLFCAGAIIVLATEAFYIEDLFHNRMNTLFKAYYQVWALWGIAAAIGLTWMLLQSRRVMLRASVAGFVVVSLLLGLVYPVTSAYRWSLEFADWKGLDGSAYIGDLSADELAGINFVRAHANADSVLLEAPGCSYQPISQIPFDRVSAFTGVPTILGWEGHESQWRSGDDALKATIRPRRDAAQGFYNEQTADLLDQYGVDFVYYGIYEAGAGARSCNWATTLPPPDRQWMNDHGFSVAFEQGDVTIWQRTA